MNIAGAGHLAVLTEGLGKRFGDRWGLADCSVEVPEGRVCALVGPNGAGKTTLLRLLAGLSAPTTGRAIVCGRIPGPDVQFLAGVGYLDQQTPLYSRLSVADHFLLGARLNPGWDDAVARDRLATLKIPFGQRVGTLSGGERAQVALWLALAKRPRLLLLDEPVAALDPLARREFLVSLAQAVVDTDLSVVLSSHLLAELERVCDYLVVLSGGHIRLCDDVDTVLSEHRSLVGPREGASAVARQCTVVTQTHTQRQSRLVVRNLPAVVDPAWHVAGLGLEEIILAYMAADGAPDAPLTSIGGAL